MNEKADHFRAAASLRSVTQRLSAASTKQFPVLIPQIAQTLLDCRSALSSTGSSRKDSPDTVVLHRFRTQITSLLNHRSPKARWGAVILIKATLELGGYEALSNSGPWVRGILNILNKPNPLSTKKLCVITLTRIFDLTHGNPALLREITTPSLPTFITACLNSVTQKAPKSFPYFRRDFTETVLRSFCHLLPTHPSIFRTFQTQLHKLLAPLLAPTPSDTNSDLLPKNVIPSDPKIVDAARSLYSILHLCTPKSGASDEFARLFAALITEAHETIDQTFRAVKEDWQSVTGVTSKQISLQGEPSSISKLDLGEWTGIYAACERLQGILALVEKFVLARRAAVVSIPVGQVIDLLIRICNTTVLSSKEGGKEPLSVQVNEQISKDEREALFSQLPAIHTAAIQLMNALCALLGAGVKPFHHIFIELMVRVFRYEKYNEAVRTSCYTTASSILESSGCGLSKAYIHHMSPMIDSSCKDLLPKPGTVQDGQPNLESAINEATKNNTPSKFTKLAESGVTSPEVKTAAAEFLGSVLSRVSADKMPRSLRTSMDYSAILGNHAGLMLASVINPPGHSPLDKAYSSILPFLARAKPEGLEVEGLIRPRLPTMVGRMDAAHEKIDEEDGSESAENIVGRLDENDEMIDEEDGSESAENLEPKGNGEDELMNGVQQSMPPDQATADPDRAGEIEVPASVRTEESVLETINGPSRTNRNNTQREVYEKDHVIPLLGGGKREPPTENSTNSEPKRQRLEQHSHEMSSQVSSNDADELSLSQPMVVAESASTRKVQVGMKTAEIDELDDDEDFVIPELTLEPDTEDEDEDQSE